MENLSITQLMDNSRRVSKRTTAGLDSGKMTKVETQSIRLSSVWGWEVGVKWWGDQSKKIWDGRLSKPGLFVQVFFVKGPVFVDTYSILFAW